MVYFRLYYKTMLYCGTCVYIYVKYPIYILYTILSTVVYYQNGWELSSSILAIPPQFLSRPGDELKVVGLVSHGVLPGRKKRTEVTTLHYVTLHTYIEDLTLLKACQWAVWYFR